MKLPGVTKAGSGQVRRSRALSVVAAATLPALLVLLLTHCVSSPVPDAAELLVAGRHQVSEGQYAVFEQAAHPGVTVLNDDFSGKRRVQDGFVLVEDGRSFLRFAGTGEGTLRLRGTAAATRDLRLRANVRFSSAQYGELRVLARQGPQRRHMLEFVLSSGDYRVGESAPGAGAARHLGAGFLDTGQSGEWQELELLLRGSELRVSLGGELLLETKELLHTDAGRLELGYLGAVDIAEIGLESLDPASLHADAEALLIEELQDDFSGAVLLPWWEPVGEVEAAGGELLLRADAEHFSHAGIRTRALFPGDGSITLRCEQPAAGTAVVVLFEMPRLEDSYAIFLAADMLMLVRFLDGSGRTLAQMPVPADIWHGAGNGRASENGRKSEQLGLSVHAGEIFLRVNDRPLARVPVAPDLTAGLLLGYAGYMQQGDEHRLNQVSITAGLPGAFAAQEYPPLTPHGNAAAKAAAAETAAEAFPPPAGPHLDNFNRRNDASWHVGANPASTATAELLYDQAAGSGVLALRFTMAAGNGLHANALRPLELDVSRYGGIAFRARAEGTQRAHIALLEAPAGPAPAVANRLNAFFTVDEQWREYRIPFTQNRFLPSAHELSLGADGVFDFARLSAVMFEVWGYEGAGALYIDDLRLLDAEAAQELGSRLVLEGFESHDRVAGALPDQRLFHSERAEAEFAVTADGGALGSAHAGELRGSKEQWEYIDLRLDGTVAAQGYDGVGFFIRGAGVSEYIFELREIEPGSSVMAALEETYQVRVPVSEDWVEWRFPFDARSMRQPRYHPLHSGEIEGDILRNLSFLAPHEQQITEMRVQIDELFLFGAGTRELRDIAVGLFVPAAAGPAGVPGTPDAILEHAMHSVFELNLGRVPGYRVQAGLVAGNLDAALRVAAAQGLPFFVRPVYTREADTVLLNLEVVNTTAGEVTRQISGSAALGLDIFRSLDDLSVSAVNTIADTNLSFRDRVQLSAQARAVYSDPLTQMPDYMIAFDGVSTIPAGPTPGSPTSGLPTPGSNGAPGLQLSPAAATGGMVLTDPYLAGIEQLSFDVRPGRDAALFYWNYRARDSHNAVRLKGRTVMVSINGFENSFAVPEEFLSSSEATGSARLDPERWYSVELRTTAPDSYELRLDGRLLGTAGGPDLRFGRVGLGVELHPAAFRNLRVVYRE